ncbi:MAG: hypothetical protein QOD77_533 [Thermoplasmata archaeon]|jgi:ribosomal protein L37AE/L43A|nr:hypothetical protein [Thermoplasmata archaeon]
MLVECPFCHGQVAPVRDAAGLMVCPRCQNTGQPSRPTQACPRCRQQVVPTRGAQGGLVCPACNNTGRPVQPANPRGPAALMVAVGAVAAFLLGFALGITVSPVFSILGLVASLALAGTGIVLGVRARRNARHGAPFPREKGLGTAGVAVGSAWAVAGTIILLAAIVAILARIDAGDVIAEDTVAIPAGEVYLQGFEVRGAPLTVDYQAEASAGTIEAGFYATADANDPQPEPGTGKAVASGIRPSGSVKLARGDHVLVMECVSSVPCRVHYKVGVGLGAPTAAMGSPKGDLAPRCGSIPAGDDPARLPAWQPKSTPTSGPYFVMESEPGDYIGGSQRFAYTPMDGWFLVTGGPSTVSLHFNNTGYSHWWTAGFTVPDACARVAPGFFEGLTRSAYGNHGSVDVGGDGRGCNTLEGAMVVDEAGYDADGKLQHVVLRFEQHCGGVAPALMGKLSWTAP